MTEFILLSLSNFCRKSDENLIKQTLTFARPGLFVYLIVLQISSYNMANPFASDPPDNPFDEDSESKNPFDSSEHEEDGNNVSQTSDNKAAVDKTAEVKGDQKKPATTGGDCEPRRKFKTSASIVRTLIPLEESTAQHHELFLQEIEAVDEYWGPTFRGVYESGQHELFLQRLEERIGKHDKDIEKMCSHHYQGFIDSVRDLLRVRSEATQLKQEVAGIDKEMRSSCRNVLAGMSRLMIAPAQP